MFVCSPCRASRLCARSNFGRLSHAVDQSLQLIDHQFHLLEITVLGRLLERFGRRGKDIETCSPARAFEPMRELGNRLAVLLAEGSRDRSHALWHLLCKLRRNTF